MGELKKFKLNNKILEDFDKLMNFHLDKVEELEINEIFINPKLYNIISLCTNLKTLSISGDLRVDVNKIIFNICKPEKLETLILNSVKLPTGKIFEKFTNIKIISLNNVKFSDVSIFFNKIVNKDKIIALNLTNVDLRKKSISIFREFENLKYLNLDRIQNCKFDDFSFLYENKEMKRFEFYNNEIDFSQINHLLRGKYKKNISINLKTTEECNILNSLEINNDGEASITVNSYDLEKLIQEVSLYKLTDLLIILENKIEINEYIRKFKKVKGKVILAIKDIAYLDIETTNKLRERLHVEYINIFDYRENIDINDLKFCYSVDEYINMRKKLEEIINTVSKHGEDIDKFDDIYDFFKNKIKYDKDVDELKIVFEEKRSSHNLYAIAINSCLNILGIESKIIGGIVNDERNLLWNQVKINDNWYNFDIATILKAKEEKKILKYAFKGKLLPDEQFYKNHVPEFGKPQICYQTIEYKKKELKNSVKNLGKFNKFMLKIKTLFNFNKIKALPAPKEDEE